MFDIIKKKLGFGCMRLPMSEGRVDYTEFNRMIDLYIAEGFNYFDTAHGYIQGMSETAIRDCLVKRYPRDSYVLTNKLTNMYFNTAEDVRPFFEKQLEICGVEYFDFYLMHSQSVDNFAHFKRCQAYEQALEFKKQGKIKHFGISFHDTADVLDTILTEYPQIEVVQIQFNYVDFDDPAVQSKQCYDVCRKHGKAVLIMEPVKGGNLVNLPVDAKEVFKKLKGGSPASYAIRFAAGFEGVISVLSGMSNFEQMADNISYMKEFKPLSEREQNAVEQVRNVLKSLSLIPCTACRYCTDGCPEHISIPDLFACLNTKNIYHDWNADFYYNEVHTKNGGKASECIECGKCEKACPQHLQIRALLKQVAKEFEN